MYYSIWKGGKDWNPNLQYENVEIPKKEVKKRAKSSKVVSLLSTTQKKKMKIKLKKGHKKLEEIEFS